MQITANVSFNNVNILSNHVFPLCALYSNVGFRPILRMVEPQEQFPRKCPIPVVHILYTFFLNKFYLDFTTKCFKIIFCLLQGDWRLNEYVINPKDFFIFNFISSGHFSMSLNVGPKDVEPFIQVAIKGVIERDDEITE